MLGITRGRLHECFATHKGRRVYVTDHTLLVDGRVSNWVSFMYLKTKRCKGDYDYRTNFTKVVPAKLVAIDKDGTQLKIPG